MDEILAAHATAEGMFDALEVVPVLFIASITQHLQGQYQGAFNQACTEQQQTHTSVGEQSTPTLRAPAASAPKNIGQAKAKLSFEKYARVTQVTVALHLGSASKQGVCCSNCYSI